MLHGLMKDALRHDVPPLTPELRAALRSEGLGGRLAQMI